MKTQLYILTLLMSFFVSCKQITIHNLDKKYPQAIVNENLQNEYDNAKWYVYYTNCDRLINCYDSNNASQSYFASINMSFDTLDYFNDDTLCVCFYNTDKNCGIVNAPKGIEFCVGVNKQNDSVLGYSFYDQPVFSSTYWSITEYQDPDFITKLDFIRNNEAKLDVWFREEAYRRGLFNYKIVDSVLAKRKKLSFLSKQIKEASSDSMYLKGLFYEFPGDIRTFNAIYSDYESDMSKDEITGQIKYFFKSSNYIDTSTYTRKLVNLVYDIDKIKSPIHSILGSYVVNYVNSNFMLVRGALHFCNEDVIHNFWKNYFRFQDSPKIPSYLKNDKYAEYNKKQNAIIKEEYQNSRR